MNDAAFAGLAVDPHGFTVRAGDVRRVDRQVGHFHCAPSAADSFMPLRIASCANPKRGKHELARVGLADVNGDLRAFFQTATIFGMSERYSSGSTPCEKRSTGRR